ncbi:MAG: ribonuclease III [Deltaproteobacteria bacterium]|nr:ribonuclease III [Deltaproteobacteria bacterium]
MTPNPDAPMASIDAALDYEFSDRALLDLALTHTSYSHEEDGGRGNERLEFLGDAVLDLAISEILYEVHPEWDEGDLTRTRSALVNQKSLAEQARNLELGRFVKLGRTEMQPGGCDKDSILANCFEALVGAIYLDGGLVPVEEFVRRVYGAALASDAVRQRRDAKTEFQEWAHARFRQTPRYEMVGDSTEDNDDERFAVEVSIGTDVWGRGVGRSKRIAEREAAAAALEKNADEEPKTDG